MGAQTSAARQRQQRALLAEHIGRAPDHAEPRTSRDNHAGAYVRTSFHSRIW